MVFKAVKLGSSKVGFGTMSMMWRPSPIPIEKCLKTLKFVASDPKLGTKILNFGDFYGPNNSNLKLLQEFLNSSDQDTLPELIISVKGALDIQKFRPDGSKEGITKSINNLLSYLPKTPKRPQILFEAARVDPRVPYKDTISFIADFVKKGVIDGISLSEVNAGQIKEAASVFPISCVEVELSLMTKDILHNGVLETCSSLNIPIVAYSPLLRGLLTDYAAENGERFYELIKEGDVRKFIGRFQKENFDANLVLIKELYDFAHSVKKTSLESLAISWILKLSESDSFSGINKVTRIIPIPSGSSIEKFKNTVGGIVELTDSDMEEIADICAKRDVQGSRSS